MKRKYWKYEAGRWIGIVVGLAGFFVAVGQEMQTNLELFTAMFTLGFAIMFIGALLYKLCEYKERYLREKKRRRRRIHIGIKLGSEVG